MWGVQADQEPFVELFEERLLRVSLGAEGRPYLGVSEVSGMVRGDVPSVWTSRTASSVLVSAG